MSEMGTIDATLYLRGKRWSVTMGQNFRRGFTAAEKTELWDRWARGESVKGVGRSYGIGGSEENRSKRLGGLLVSRPHRFITRWHRTAAFVRLLGVARG